MSFGDVLVSCRRRSVCRSCSRLVFQGTLSGWLGGRQSRFGLGLVGYVKCFTCPRNDDQQASLLAQGSILPYHLVLKNGKFEPSLISFRGPMQLFLAISLSDYRCFCMCMIFTCLLEQTNPYSTYFHYPWDLPPRIHPMPLLSLLPRLPSRNCPHLAPVASHWPLRRPR